MEKPKRKAKTSDYDFSFVAPLSLEECAERIENELFFPGNFLWWTLNYGVPAKTSLINEHQAHFRVKSALPDRRAIYQPTVLSGYLERQTSNQTVVYGNIHNNTVFHFCLIPNLIIGGLVFLIGVVNLLSNGFSIPIVIFLIHGLIFVYSFLGWPHKYKNYTLRIRGILQEKLNE